MQICPGLYCEHQYCSDYFDQSLKNFTDQFHSDLENGYCFDPAPGACDEYIRLQQAKRSFSRPKEVNVSVSAPKYYRYFVTLTTLPDDPEGTIQRITDSFLASKMIANSLVAYMRCYELTDEEYDLPHSHLYLLCSNYVEVSKIKKLKNFKDRRINFQVPKNISKVKNYIKKCHPNDVAHFSDDQYYEWCIENDPHVLKSTSAKNIVKTIEN